MTHRQVFELDRADPLSSRLDQVLDSIRDVHVPIGVDRRDVPRREPPLTVEHLIFLSAIVGSAHPRSTHLEFTKGFSVTGQRFTLGVHDFHLNAVDGPPLPNLDVVALRVWGHALLRLEYVDRPDGAHFRHAPALSDLNTKFLVESLHHRARHRGPTDDRYLEGGNAGIMFAPIVQ